MKRLFPGTSKTVIVQTEDALEFLVQDYPLARIVTVTRRHRDPFFALGRAWRKLMAWSPTDKQLSRMAVLLEGGGALISNALKCAVVLAAFYFALEIGSAFLSGAPAHLTVERLLGGLR